MSEDIIDSVFSFFKISKNSENRREENGKFIKTWKINTDITKDEAQIEEEEEINQENILIAILNNIFPYYIVS